MYNIERLCARDHDELLAFFNDGFGYPHDEGFDKLLPVMWRRDDLHMGHHLAIRESGKIIAALGVYPLTVHIAGKELLFATCGNVATAKEHRGKNCMRELMFAAMDELDRIGADVARLGGQRQRYERYGFEIVGTKRTYTLTQKNLAEKPRPALDFVPVERTDAAVLDFTRVLQTSEPFYVDRGGREDLYDILCAWKNQPYLAKKADGTPVGVLSVSADHKTVAEVYASSAEEKYEILQAWMWTRGVYALTGSCLAWERELARLIGRDCENMTVSGATQCRIMNWEKLCDALMKLDPSRTEDPFVLGIDGYDTLRFAGNSCEKTDDTPDLVLDRLTAARFLLGWDDPVSVADVPPEKRCVVRARFPLCMGWNGQDRV